MSPGDRMRAFVAFELTAGKAPPERLANLLVGNAVKLVWHDPIERVFLANLLIAVAEALDPDIAQPGLPRC